MRTSYNIRNVYNMYIIYTILSKLVLVQKGDASAGSLF